VSQLRVEGVIFLLENRLSRILICPFLLPVRDRENASFSPSKTAGLHPFNRGMNIAIQFTFTEKYAFIRQTQERSSDTNGSDTHLKGLPGPSFVEPPPTTPAGFSRGTNIKAHFNG